MAYTRCIMAVDDHAKTYALYYDDPSNDGSAELHTLELNRKPPVVGVRFIVVDSSSLEDRMQFILPNYTQQTLAEFRDDHNWPVYKPESVPVNVYILDVRPYDVLQTRRLPDGLWEDYVTIRDEHEYRRAIATIRKVTPTSEYDWRIKRNGRAGYLTVYAVQSGAHKWDPSERV